MRNNIKSILILLSMIAVITGCNRKMAISSTEGKRLQTFDTAAFDFVYTEAIKQKLMGNAGEALRYFEQAVIINKNSDAVYYQMAQIFLQTGDMLNCKGNALKAYKLDDRNIWYMTFLAGLYYQEKNIDSAILYYERIITLYPGKENVRFNLGNIYSEKGDYEKAGNIFRYFEEKYGFNENIALPYIKNLISSGELKRAEEKLLSVIEEQPDEIMYTGMLAEIYNAQGEKEKAVEVYMNLMEKDPANPQTLLSLCDFLIENKIYEELFNILNTVILNNQIRKEDKISLCGRLLEDKESVGKNGNETEMAIRLLEATYKEDQIVKMLLPELYLKQGRRGPAQLRLEQIVNQDANNYFAWEKLLIIYSEEREYDKLLKAGKECATRFNMWYLAKILYASAATEKGFYDIALEELRKAKIVAGNEPELLVQAITMEADVYYRKGDYDTAFELFREALKSNPEDLIVLNNFAYYLSEQNRDLKEAEKMAAFVIEKDKENTTYLDTYAWILYKRGKTRDAAKIMKEIIDGGASDSDYFIHYGYILKASGKCNEAIIYWKKVLAGDPDNEEINEEIRKCIK